MTAVCCLTGPWRLGSQKPWSAGLVLFWAVGMVQGPLLGLEMALFFLGLFTSPCVCLCPQVPFLEGHQPYWMRATRTTSHSLPQPHFQIGSYSGVLVVRRPICEYRVGGHKSTHNSPALTRPLGTVLAKHKIS